MSLPDPHSIRVVACDLNGQMRGKRIPGHKASKVDKGVRMPLSALNVDIWGYDIVDSPLVFATGDADGVLVPTERGMLPMPWLQSPSAMVPMQMTLEDGAPFPGDPRQSLCSVLAKFAARGWTVMGATEMEFTLVDDSGDQPAHVRNPQNGRRLSGPAVLSVQELDVFEAFFDDLYAGCEAMGIPIDTATTEAGTGQFEVTLTHQTALRAADDAWLFKTLAHGLARRHGMAASFMAKLYPDDSGNGMHVHFSVVDDAGRNVFDNGGHDGTPLLQSAVAGCLQAMPDCTLIFAPHRNSYARLVPGAHAPTAAAWAYENRTAALRIPGGPSVARRIEHRSAGGDVNPYLMLAAVLGAAMMGIDQNATPPAPVTGNAYDIPGLPQLATDWPGAITALEHSQIVPQFLHPDLITNLVLTKRQELRGFADIEPEQDWKTLLETA